MGEGERELFQETIFDLIPADLDPKDLITIKAQDIPHLVKINGEWVLKKMPNG